MAPEQRKGKAVDARTDIYALGLVLYEAATGKGVVQGQSPAVDGLPDKFAHVVERCLAQEAEYRWQTARDVKAELEWAAKSQAPVPAPLRRSVPRWVWVAGALAVIAAVGGSSLISTQLALEICPRPPRSAPYFSRHNERNST
jgi:serine/threonine protein kinase